MNNLRRAAVGCLFWAMGAACCLVFLGGCIVGDGRVSVEGWVVPDEQGPSRIEFVKTRAEPAREVVGATVELWSRDGRELLSKGTNVHNGYFVAYYTGPYQPGMMYVLKAYAKGYRSLERELRLDQAKAQLAMIYLVPADGD